LAALIQSVALYFSLKCWLLANIKCDDFAEISAQHRKPHSIAKVADKRVIKVEVIVAEDTKCNKRFRTELMFPNQLIFRKTIINALF
jgi:hypothetical protein